MRRALTEDELRRLLKAARLRPVAERGRNTVSLPPEEKKGRSTWRYEDLTFETLDAAYERGRQALQGSPRFLGRQERLGLERMLIYKAMVLTGLRLGELASITVGQLHLGAAQPYAELLARDAKAGSQAMIPLRRDLVDDLRGWLAEKLEGMRVAAEERDMPIPKEDERGRTVDLHALRHTFGTHLSKNGVPPRKAQAAIRHSGLDSSGNA